MYFKTDNDATDQLFIINFFRLFTLSSLAKGTYFLSFKYSSRGPKSMAVK